MTYTVAPSLFALLFGLSLAGPACAGPKAPAAAPKKEDKVSAPLRVEETTVADVHGWRVTVGNIMRDKWRGADNKEREGITAEIGLYDEGRQEKLRKTLGEGAEIVIAGRRYTLLKVQAGQGGGNGHVELRAEP